MDRRENQKCNREKVKTLLAISRNFYGHLNFVIILKQSYLKTRYRRLKDFLTVIFGVKAKSNFRNLMIGLWTQAYQ